MWTKKFEFSQNWRTQIVEYVQSCGIELKVIEDQDTPEIKQFLQRRYEKAVADEICAYDLYQFRKFGHGVLLQGEDGTIQGCIFEVGYDTMDKTSYTIRLAVYEGFNGHNLGYHLMIYSSLLSMEQGSRVKRGLIQVENLKSLYINLNKVGWICDGFEPQITELGTFYEIALPLDPMGLTANRIDKDGLLTYIAEKEAGQEYRLLDHTDIPTIQAMYEETDFKICAVVKEGWLNEHPWLFALPGRSLQFSPI
ncbi:MAG: hypothetical protein AAF399_11220 [Bacteroidota bacterium]